MRVVCSLKLHKPRQFTAGCEAEQAAERVAMDVVQRIESDSQARPFFW